MYPYHNRIKQRIKNGELVGILENYNHPRIGLCTLFVFSTPPYTRPVRAQSLNKYPAEMLENARRISPKSVNLTFSGED